MPGGDVIPILWGRWLPDGGLVQWIPGDLTKLPTVCVCGGDLVPAHLVDPSHPDRIEHLLACSGGHTWRSTLSELKSRLIGRGGRMKPDDGTDLLPAHLPPVCGLPAAFVVRNLEGLEWFVCAAHGEAPTPTGSTWILRTPFLEWFQARGLEAPDPAERVCNEALEGGGAN